MLIWLLLLVIDSRVNSSPTIKLLLETVDHFREDLSWIVTNADELVVYLHNLKEVDCKDSHLKEMESASALNVTIIRAAPLSRFEIHGELKQDVSLLEVLFALQSIQVSDI